MNIRIGKYAITSDSICLTLHEVATRGENAKNPGEEYLSAIGYYGDLEQCMQGLLRHVGRTSEATTIRELLDEIRSIRKMTKFHLEGTA